jgi:putative membrane protein insertion efficiency factor
MQKLALFLISFYQKLPLHSHSSCRFSPTCSQYAYQAIAKYGILKGILFSVKRILRCHPGTSGGYDPVV